ncbi:MAG TPA: ABC transporter substrate-binding protein [Xanthobacteraceae bacterium]|jgi:NitT/TauT family transport system substrate-binding protein
MTVGGRLGAVAAFVVGLMLLHAPICSAAEKEVRIALSFPNGVVWPYFSVAAEMGYAKEEGIAFRLTSTEGSAASYKALATKQVDFAMTQPAQILNGIALGESIIALYTAYQGHVFQFATLADSPYKRVADLKGTKIGISSVAGGQNAYLRATLKQAGLDPGTDVQIAEIGRGGAAAIALKEKRVAAYSASFVDMMTIEQTGEKLRLFMEGPTATFFSDVLAAQRSMIEQDPKLIVAVGRAIAKGTAFCFANADACWEMVARQVPDTTRKPEFTKPLLKAVLELHRLPPEAQGKWGYQRPAAWQAVEDFLLDSGQLKEKVDTTKAFTNEYIAAINEFDAAKIQQQAAQAK